MRIGHPRVKTDTQHPLSHHGFKVLDTRVYVVISQKTPLPFVRLCETILSDLCLDTKSCKCPRLPTWVRCRQIV